MDGAAWARRVLRGEVRAAAGLMRDLDDGVPAAQSVLRKLYAAAGRAHVVGLTGAPGSGKSTLADQLIDAARGQGRSVGVVAVDPTSHISGGAVLGDRVRMQRHANDKKVFIRSLATRGSLGGLSRAVFDTVTVLDAMGKDLILIETAGVGQDGVKIAGAAHTVLVVLAPGQGDEIQAIKAGVLEIGDIYVVNKSDRPGTDELVASLRLALEPSQRPVVKTAAVSGRGVARLLELIGRHRKELAAGPAWQKRSQAMARTAFMELMEVGMRARLEQSLAREKSGRRLLRDLGSRRTDPYTAAQKALRRIFSRSGA